MASIIIKDLDRLPNKRNFTYSDIEMDLKIDYTKTNPLNNIREQRDIVADYDLNAIKNSVYNMFTTMPGQKLLNPIYGLNLYQFLFTGITKLNAEMLGDSILRGFITFEPRITVEKINITPDIENQQYQIDLVLSVPSLNIRGLEIKSSLSESGYYFN
jgi:phage baseplate assembly protein W